MVHYKMTDEELINAIDGLMAYHYGCTYSGISSPMLKQRCIEEIGLRFEDPELNALFTRYIHEMTNPKEGKFTIDDVSRFISYLSNEMGWYCQY